MNVDCRRFAASALVLALAGSVALSAQVVKRADSDLDRLAVADGRLLPPSRTEPLALHAAELGESVTAGWLAFQKEVGGTWQADVDPRNGCLGFVEGSGLPWIPGHGNALTDADVAALRAPDGAVGLATLEALARSFLAAHGAMLGVEPAELRLSPGRSGHVAPHLWLVDFDVLRDGLALDGARVVFRVNNGNLIQIGTENLPPPTARVPRATVSRAQALEQLRAYVGDFDAAWDHLLDAGTLRALPAVSAIERATGGEVFGAGLEVDTVWEFRFRRDGVVGTWRARVDATTGDLVEFLDINEYATAQVTGGSHIGDNLPPDTIVAMPFADLSIGGFTNSAGQYDYTSGTVTSTLNGQYVRIVDTCGAISQSSGAGGNIAFGSSTGTDCTTPGSGGAGNTRATRTQFYNVNRAKETGRGWLPANAWLSAQLRVNVNIAQTCNAYWNGSTLNFFHSGGGCANTGELPGVSLHEWGHGMDSNDGNGSSPDNGTGETYGDFSAALNTHQSCIGGGFLGGNCGGYGNACTSCTGVRDIDWAKHTRNTPSTVSNFTRTDCPAAGGYAGPCNREGHCESLVPSEALWDFAARDLPNPGSGAAWSITDRLWYLSRSTATGAFVCTTSGSWSSNGCATGTLWRTMRAADDDNGNLNDGTPHSCNLYAAFNRHLVACTTDAGANTCFAACTPPATPTVTATPGNNQVALSWTSSGAGVSYDVYRNEVGCSAGFVRIASGLTVTSYTDTAVANGTTYYYQVVAYPTGNGACAGAPSTCANATPTPCPTISTPTGGAASATAPNQITVSWNDSATGSVTSYDVLRATVSGGPYTLIGNVPDSGAGPWSYQDNTVSGGTTYYYVVRANAAGGCQSANSSQVSATATGECTLAPTFAGLSSVTNLGGGQGCGLRVSWTAATAQCTGNGSLTYAVYRSTTSGFTPGPSNLIAACVSGTSWDDTTMPLDTSVYYVVRAEDSASWGTGPCNNGNLDTNLAQASGYASSVAISGTLYSNDFETGSGLADWTTGIFGGSNAADWRGIQTCTAHSGSKIFRFGGNTCAGNYGSGDFAFAQPNGAGGIAVPAGSTTLRLTFWHRWVFEDGWDGAMLAVSLDGTNYTLVPASAILLNPYNGTTDNGAGYPAWTGTQATFVNTIVNLDAACVAAGAVGGCGGQSVRIAFTGYSDGLVTDDGWFLDDVAVTRDGYPACTAAPQPVQFLTATGKDTQVTLEWLDPAAGPFASTRLRSSLVSYPADPTAGTLEIDEPGATNQKESYLDTALANGTPVFYAAFANSGASVFSARRIVSGLPQSAAGNWKWNFATPASALAPPIQGRGLGVYVPSNDRAFYALAVGSAGGTWKTGYAPAAMNAPAQSSPVVILAAESGLPHDATYVASQDGYLYCFNAATGLGCTGWPAGGRSAAAFGLVQAQPMFDPTTRRVLFGSRNAAAANGFYAVNAQTGATAWSYTNAVGQGGDGQAMGIVSGPALILGSRAVFASRTRTGGSAHTVWALDFTAGTVSFAWARDLGDIDGAPTQDWTLNRVVVGTNGGSVHALDPASGASAWTRAFGDGAIRSWLYYDAAVARLYFATNTRVWSVPASGTTGSDWSVSGLISPTRPILHFGTGRAYLGACADAGCANGRVIELDRANAWATPKTYDLAGVGGLGPVTIDRTQSPAVLHAGSRTGRVIAVQVPLP